MSFPDYILNLKHFKLLCLARHIAIIIIYSPLIRVLGRGGIDGLVVRALTQNVRGMGLNPN